MNTIGIVADVVGILQDIASIGLESWAIYEKTCNYENVSASDLAEHYKTIITRSASAGVGAAFIAYAALGTTLAKKLGRKATRIGDAADIASNDMLNNTNFNKLKTAENVDFSKPKNTKPTTPPPPGPRNRPTNPVPQSGNPSRPRKEQGKKKGCNNKSRCHRKASHSCFVAGTLVHTINWPVAIETLGELDRVKTLSNEERLMTGIEETESSVQAESHRIIRLQMKREDCGETHITLVRSLSWIADHCIFTGGFTHLSMSHMGADGIAEVLAIEDCPEIEPGEGKLITGTFRHSAGTVYDLKLAGEDVPIGVTGTHPFWSVDREDWVAVADLKIGETLKTLVGTTTVQVVESDDTPASVYNVEVDGDHVYRVGESGVLVHNASANADSNADSDVYQFDPSKRESQPPSSNSLLDCYKFVGLPDGNLVPISKQQPLLFFNNKPEDINWTSTNPKSGPLTLSEIREKRYSGSWIYVIVPKRSSPGWFMVLGRDNAGVHSELAKGYPVFAAGEVVFNRGRFESVNNKSGHYRPIGTHAKTIAISAFAINEDQYKEIV